MKANITTKSKTAFERMTYEVSELEALQLLRHHTEVDIPSVNTVFFEFKSLSARLSISDRFSLDGNFDSSVGLFLSNLNSDANALF